MAWFNRSRKNLDAREEERLRREMGELIDNNADRSTVVEGDRVLLNPQQVLDNIQARMERVDLDPDTGWHPKSSCPWTRRR